MAKKDDLKNELTGTPKKNLKKQIPNIKENEAITKAVFDKKDKKEILRPSSDSKKTTIDLPEKVHRLAKMVALEESQSLKNYLGGLVIDDLVKRGKM